MVWSGWYIYVDIQMSCAVMFYITGGQDQVKIINTPSLCLITSLLGKNILSGAILLELFKRQEIGSK